MALGQYDEFAPYAVLRGRTVDLELARTAHVAVLAVRTPTTEYSERPVVFTVLYPRFDTDRTQFGPGRHRLTPRRQTLQEPPNCRVEQRPSLTGCRRAEFRYIGTGITMGQAYLPEEMQYLVIASEEFVDPYTLADDLYLTATDDEALSLALRRRDANASERELERALLDRPGSPLWGAFYAAMR
jgi:hypothetical protein